MDQIFEIRDTSGAQLMAPGHKGNVRAYFDQNDYEGEVRRFDEDDVTEIVSADVRDSECP